MSKIKELLLQEHPEWDLELEQFWLEQEENINI